ncbi:multicopper oxidase domain-containing protein [Sinosporangium siamense]|uniref:multicopper oxidase domain-containing protein n=1 Tax=Sinosporangium siamense TaxID=1367973 RepID=UPI00194EA828|nr:multicopper oxidase domain-containing protein [Sinosporangium siamense]
MRDFAFRTGRMHGGHGLLIGGLPFDPARSDVTTGLGDVEVWRLIAEVHHPVHLHLAGFRVLSRGVITPAIIERIGTTAALVTCHFGGGGAP